MTRRQQAAVAYRRLPHVVIWWDGPRAVARNYRRDRAVVVDTPDVGLLGLLQHWRTAAQLAAVRPRRPLGQILTALTRLRRAGLIEASNRAPEPLDCPSRIWEDWGPAAGLLHFGTRNQGFVDAATDDEILRVRQAAEPSPPPAKAMRGERFPLPRPAKGRFPSVLLARRSWRRFGSDPIALRDLATLLGLTWGTQRWMHFNDKLTRPLKTSPSGGACHSLEVYVAARRVDGLSSGVYHYRHDSHRLVRLKSGCSRAWIVRALAGQTWFGDCAAVMFMTSVFARTHWKYRHGHAYRAILLEAGHFCQTFCLTATWLGLAPFCTAAFEESVFERVVGADGHREALIYAAGVGVPPADVSWAPYPHAAVPPTSAGPLGTGSIQ